MPSTPLVGASPSLTLEPLLHRLFTAHVDSVFNVAYRVTWNRADAEDVVQSSFLKVIVNHGQLDDPSRERAWVLQVAYREAIAVLRRRREQPIDPSVLPDSPSADPSPDEAVVLSDLARMISGAFERMTAPERMAVVLRDVEGLAMKEVASVMGLGLSAAKMRVHRGRQTLRILLESEGLRGTHSPLRGDGGGSHRAALTASMSLSTLGRSSGPSPQ